MNKNLIVLRAGDKSLHPQWLDQSKNWDLALSYYGDFVDRYKGQCDFFHHYKGSKWKGLSNFLKTFKYLDQYEYIWFPDDDILSFCNDINLFFDLSKKFKFVISQPSLTNFSYYTWSITLQDTKYIARKTNFIEIMAPCFELKHFNFFRETFDKSDSGWGMEWVWSHIAKKNDIFNFGIIDAVPIYHIRPVGSAGHGGSTNPRKEMSQLLSLYNVSTEEPSILGFWEKL